MRLRRTLAMLLLVLVMAAAGPPAPAAAAAPAGRTLVVGAGGTHASLAAALAEARPGDTVEVHGGVHPAPVQVDRSIRLIGVDNPVIDGGGHGHLVRVTAPDVEISGFTIRGSGTVLDQEHGGITAVDAPRTVIRHNRLEDTLFGINLQKSADSIVDSNIIIGKNLDVGVRGDPIKVWYSPRTQVIRNTIRHGRDVILWFSEHTVLAENVITESRYGIHFMYTHDATVRDNLLSGNSVGAFVMYSVGLSFHHNLVVQNRGPSGYALAFKDSEQITIRENWLLGNRVGLYLDSSPYSRGVRNRIEQNVIAGNDTGVLLMPTVLDNDFTANTFIDNLEQMALTARGVPGVNDWAPQGVGNYWSDYAGYDADGDGKGDVPYRAQSLFEDLMVRHETLRWFRFSPAAMAVDLAARTFPTVQPEPKLEDPAPLTRAQLPVMAAPVPRRPAGPLLAVSLGLLGVAAAVAWLLRPWRPAPAAVYRSEGVAP